MGSLGSKQASEVVKWLEMARVADVGSIWIGSRCNFLQSWMTFLTLRLRIRLSWGECHPSGHESGLCHWPVSSARFRHSHRGRRAKRPFRQTAVSAKGLKVGKGEVGRLEARNLDFCGMLVASLT